MSKFTPGPYRVERDGATLFRIDGPGGCHVTDYILNRPTADLLASAPDLYAACKTAASFLDDVVSGNSISIGASLTALLAVRAALSKADGGAA